MKCFLFTLSRMEAIAMQELSSLGQRHLENQTEGEPSNENDQLPPPKNLVGQGAREDKKEELVQNKRQTLKKMISILKVMWKLCTTVYDIASDFLQGKQALLLIFPKLSTCSLKWKTPVSIITVQHFNSRCAIYQLAHGSFCT